METYTSEKSFKLQSRLHFELEMLTGQKHYKVMHVLSLYRYLSSLVSTYTTVYVYSSTIRVIIIIIIIISDLTCHEHKLQGCATSKKFKAKNRTSVAVWRLEEMCLKISWSVPSQTRSVAVPKKADCIAAYNVRHNCRTEPLKMQHLEEPWSRDHSAHGCSRCRNFGGSNLCCVLWTIYPTATVAKRYFLQRKCLKKWIESAILGTWWYNF